MNYLTQTRKVIPLLVAALTIIGGTLVLAGWALDLPILKSIHPDWVSMKANTALGFILAGLALMAQVCSPTSTSSLRLARFCAMLFGLIGLLTLSEYLFDLNPGFDQWLFVEPADTTGTSHPGRMAPDTALCFILLTAALLLACDSRKMMRLMLASVSGSLVMIISLTNLLAYLTNDISILGLGGQTLMAAHTATLFVLLSIALALPAWTKNISLWSFHGKHLMLLALWNLIIDLSLVWNLHQQGHYLIDSATLAAQTNINKDLSFRRWATTHGGVYVSPNEHTPPNPYLKVPDRDVVTTSGKALTLMNPAYMLREIQQNFGQEYGNRSRLVSLQPLNPANAPDAWQRKALLSFAQGDQGLQDIQYLEGQLYLRRMQPIFVEAGCLKCHGQQGYQLGDIRGGIETAIVMSPFIEQSKETIIGLTLSHAVVWLLGLSTLLLFYRREHYLDAESQRVLTALHQSEERFRLAAETANDLVYEWDLQDSVIWSARIDKILGYGPGEFPRTMTAWQKALHPDDIAQIMAAVQAHLTERTPYAVEYRVRHKDDTYQWWSARGVAIRNPEGTPLRWIGTVTDITRQKLEEEEKEKLASQLRQAQKMEAIGTLAGGIAHDFNNILSIIFGYNELAMREKDPEVRQQHLQQLQQGAKRAQELVKQILAFSRKAEQQKQPLQISLIIKEALKMLRASLPTTIEIRQNIVSTGLVLADSTKIHQVIMNLCTNAYQAMRESGGTLAVSLTEVSIGPQDYGYADLPPGNYLKLEVSDTGCGIEPQLKEKIFEPYFTTKETGKGTGLGLAVVYGIVKSHHGQITVYSEVGKGTSFHVYLPLTEQAAVTLPKIVAPTELRGKGEMVLVVDDEAMLREIVTTVLSTNGYQVTTCTDGVEAWEKFQKNPEHFELVITDMTMPTMTGAALAEKILTLRPQTPVILCTGQSDLINGEKALALGICAYLNKPVPIDELLGAVKKALDRAAQPIPEKASP